MSVYETVKNTANDTKPRILLAYAGKTTTADIMIRLMDKYSKMIDIDIVSKDVLSITVDDINLADTVLIIRGADFFLSKLITKAKKAGKQCIFYIDDDLLALYKEGSEFYGYLINCLKKADILWSSNRNVLDRYYKYIGQNTKCVETVVLDPWDGVEPYTKESDKVKLIFAGSPSHEQIIMKYIYPALQKVYEKNNKIEVLFVGYKGSLLDGRCPYIRTTGWFDNAEEYRTFLIGEQAQIGIAIIEDSSFGKCKFYNKFLEYTKLGLMGIYSNCEPYTFVIKDGVNGLLVNNTIDDWAETIMYAIEKPKLREECVRNAQNMMCEHFTTEQVIRQINESIPEFNEYRPSRIAIQYNVKNLIIEYVFRKNLWYVFHPIEIIRKLFDKLTFCDNKEKHKHVSQ